MQPIYAVVLVISKGVIAIQLKTPFNTDLGPGRRVKPYTYTYKLHFSIFLRIILPNIWVHEIAID